MIIDYTAQTYHGEKVEGSFKYDGIDGDEKTFIERMFNLRNVEIKAKRKIR